VRFDTKEHKEIALQLVKIAKFVGEEIDVIYNFVQAVRGAQVGLENIHTSSCEAQVAKQLISVPTPAAPVGEAGADSAPSQAQEGALAGSGPTAAAPSLAPPSAPPVATPQGKRWSRKPKGVPTEQAAPETVA